MPDRLTDAILAAHDLIAELKSAPVEKTIWGSPAGKKRLAARLVGLLPDHETYVEPFAGSGAVLFAKEPAATEVINDADPEIVAAYRTIKGLKPEQLVRLRRMKWTGDRDTYERLRASHPRDQVAKLHRFLYLAHFSYGKLRGRSFNPNATGIEAATLRRLEKHGPRLKGVRIHCGDYERVVRKYDAKDAAFYLDPPYPGYNVAIGESDFDEERLLSVLKGIRGKFLMTYGIRGELPARFEDEGFWVKRIRPNRSIGTMRGVGGAKTLTTLLVSNYKLVSKSLVDHLGEDWLVEEEPADKAEWSRAFVNDLPDDSFLYIEPGGRKDDEGKTVPRDLRHFPVRDETGEIDLPHLRNAVARIPQSQIPGLTPDDLRGLQDKARRLLENPAAPAAKGEPAGGQAFAKSLPLIKGANPADERYVLGIVLEPETVDAQGDIYSADEVRQAAHRFMEDFGGLGLMHQMRVNGQVKILESYLAPADFAIAETNVRRGTWLLAVRVLSDDLWTEIRDGQLTGFSIGGTARRGSLEPAPQEAAA